MLLIHVSAYAETPTIIPSNDMTYLGAFKLPAPPDGYSWLGIDPGGNGMKGMEYNPTDQSLIVLSSRNLYRYLTEVSIPTPVISKSISMLPTANWIHSAPVDITNGLQQQYTHLGDIHYLPKRGNQTTDKLYWSIYGSYRPCNPLAFSNGHFGWAETDLEDLKSTGMWRFRDCGSNCCAFSGKYLFHAPQTWADSYTDGKSLIQGYTRAGGSTSEGPVMFAFAPWQEGNPPPDANDGMPPTGTGNNEPPALNYLSHKVLLQYGGPPSGGSVPYHIQDEKSPNDSVNSGRWITIGDKQAIVFNGTKCLRNYADYNWSYPANYYPAATIYGDNEGYHADPCSPVLWFYDVDDITDVAVGNKQPYEPQPYRRIELGQYFLQPATRRAAGMAYDEASGRLFIEEAINSTTEVIHVFSLTDKGAAALDAVPPLPPSVTLDNANKNSVTFRWNSVADNSGLPVLYRVYRNGQPIAIQTETTYTDSYMSFYPSPVEYSVRAVDFEGNFSESNPLPIDQRNGGNAPINIYIPSLCPPNAHETSCIKFRLNQFNTVPIYIKGGTPPYIWSANGLPDGMVINPDSGIITGTPINTYVSYGGELIVRDADGNFARRKTAIHVASPGSSYYNDRDQDGVSSLDAGGSDFDDLNSDNTPGMIYSQPAPSGVQITESTGTSINLSWIAAGKRTDPTWWIQNGIATGRNNQIGLDITYHIYHGMQPGVYDPNPTYVGRATNYTATGLGIGTHYFAVTAIDFHGLESIKSNVVSLTLNSGSSSTPSLNGQAYGAYHAEGMDETNKIVQTRDGGAVMASFTTSYSWLNGPGTEARRVFLVKMDSAGTEQWRRIIGPESYNIRAKMPQATTHWVATSIAQTETGDLFIAGYRTFKSPYNDGFLMKLDSSGNLIWDRDYTGPYSHDWINDIVAKTAGGFAMAGQSYSAASNVDAWLVLTDADGLNPIQMHYSSNGKGYETVKTVRKTSDGGYVMVGYTATNASTADEDYYIVKTASDGTLQWAQKFDNDGRRDKAQSVEEDANGNYWIFGRSQKPDVENTKIWIVKSNSQGIKQADYFIGDDVESNAYVAKNSIKLPNGNFLILGYTNVSHGGGYDGYIAQLSTAGTVQGNAKMVGADTANHEDYLFHGVISSDGTRYLLAGTNNGGFSTYYDLWFLSLSVSDLSVQNFTSCGVKTAFYYDKDLDGIGNNNQWPDPMGGACFQMPGFVLSHNDPDDAAPKPAAPPGLRISR